MRRLIVVLFVLFVSISALAQQEYVGRFDATSGFSYLAEPKLNLAERGVNFQGGVNIRRWLALGADYNYFWGHSTLNPSSLALDKQQALAPLALLFPGQPIFVPFDSNTWTFAAGPQLNYRHFKSVTLFARPVLGVMHEQVTLKPTTPVATFAVAGLLGPGINKKDDTATFYGFGGGIDFNLTKHFAIRTQADYVHVFLFEGTLASARNAARVSIGPAFHFGGNVK